MYFLHRFAFFVLTLFLSLVFSFLLMHLAPGDPVDLLLGELAPPTQKAAFQRQLGLDLPLTIQFKKYVASTLTLDFGQSLAYQRPIGAIIRERLAFTSDLALVGIFMSAILGLTVGILAALLAHFRIPSLCFLILSVLGQSTPNFFLGPVLVLIFSIHLNLLPVSGIGNWTHLVLPALTLALSLFAIISRMTFAGLIEESYKDYFLSALAKGVSRIKALTSHALRNVSIPIANLLGLQLGALLTGAVVTESIFDWPGVGSLFFSAIEKRDFPLIQTLILLFTTSFAVINFGVDLLNGILDPRLRRKPYESS